MALTKVLTHTPDRMSRSNMLLIFTSLIHPLCFYTLQCNYCNREPLLNSLHGERLSLNGLASGICFSPLNGF